MPFVFDFDHTHARPPMELKDLLGGKGANLAEMTSVLQLPVPPGFTISTDACRAYMAGGWPKALDAEVAGARARLEKAMGKTIGDASDPLARVRALGGEVLHARDDGHRPQPRPQRRVRRGPGQADGRRAVRLRLVPALHRHVRPHRLGAPRRGVRLALRRRQGAGRDDVGRQGPDRAAALSRRLLPADRRAPHRQALPPEADRAAARRHRGRLPQLERSPRHRVSRPGAHRP